MRVLILLFSVLISFNVASETSSKETPVQAKLTPQGIHWVISEQTTATDGIILTFSRPCDSFQKYSGLLYGVGCSFPQLSLSGGAEKNVVYLKIGDRTVFDELTPKDEGFMNFLRADFSNAYFSSSTADKVLNAAHSSQDVMVHIVWEDRRKNLQKKVFWITATDMNEYLNSTHESAAAQVGLDNLILAIGLIAFIAAGFAIVILGPRKSKVVYSKSKEIYAKKKEDTDKKRVARLVEDEALKIQVRKDMQSAPATTESILKEQINEALSRGDSKLASELLDLFKLTQENKK